MNKSFSVLLPQRSFLPQRRLNGPKVSCLSPRCGSVAIAFTITITTNLYLYVASIFTQIAKDNRGNGRSIKERRLSEAQSEGPACQTNTCLRRKGKINFKTDLEQNVRCLAGQQGTSTAEVRGAKQWGHAWQMGAHTLSQSVITQKGGSQRSFGKCRAPKGNGRRERLQFMVDYIKSKPQNKFVFKFYLCKSARIVP